MGLLQGYALQVTLMVLISSFFTGLLEAAARSQAEGPSIPPHHVGPYRDRVMEMIQSSVSPATRQSLSKAGWKSSEIVDQHSLPIPENISIESINLKHILHWEALKVPGNVTYSVESQGEYESRYMKFYWHKTENCQEISANWCNVTAEVSANVFYKFRVRSELGKQLSDWAELEPPFHRKKTLLNPPKVDLQVSELNLVAYIEDNRPNFQFIIFYWQKGREDNIKCKKTNSYASSTFLEKAQEGKEYCAEVIAHASPINRNSSKSKTVCVQVQELKQTWLFTGLLCVFGVVLAIVPIVLAAWKSAAVIRYFCCPDEDIPDALKEPDVSQKMLKNYYSSEKKSEEIYSVEIHEDMLFKGK